MTEKTFISSVTHFIHANFLPLLILSYVAAALFPQFGLWLRQVTLGSISVPGLGNTNLSLGLIMLSFLLLNAGLGIQTQELLGIKKKPLLLLVGFLANMLVPMLLILGVGRPPGSYAADDFLHFGAADNCSNSRSAHISRPRLGE